MILYAQVDERGAVHLVNHLGIRLGDDPEEILGRLERGHFRAADIALSIVKCRVEIRLGFTQVQSLRGPPRGGPLWNLVADSSATLQG
jgi:hypothetical protein